MQSFIRCVVCCFGLVSARAPPKQNFRQTHGSDNLPFVVENKPGVGNLIKCWKHLDFFLFIYFWWNVSSMLCITFYGLSLIFSNDNDVPQYKSLLTLKVVFASGDATDRNEAIIETRSDQNLKHLTALLFGTFYWWVFGFMF